ncbi:HEPN domain-containing protein [Methanococcoides sp. FTZ1]|uniref:HEPN domain-containing protein n=1 Tax=Methanococcoides sp. FTZ1 TaxID=3439061 RepID=UPI003F840CFC
MKDDINADKKTIFIISFLALIFALPTYRDYLEPIEIPFFSYTPSIYYLFLIMGAILFLSVYMYAIHNLKYSSLKLIKIDVFRHVTKIADFLYATAIIGFPVVIFVLYVSSKLLNVDSEILMNLASLIGVLLALISTTYTYINSSRSNEIRLEGDIEKAGEFEANSLLKAIQAYENGYYNVMLLELSNAIEKSLYAKLAKMNLVESKRHISLLQMVSFAESEKILNAKQVELIKKIRSIRNQVAHGKYTMVITKEYAESYIKEVQRLTDEINNGDE